MNPTNDPTLRSWVPVAADSHFPIQNLPYGTFMLRDCMNFGVRIGDEIVLLCELAKRGFFANCSFAADWAFGALGPLPFLAVGPKGWSEARAIVSRLLRHDEPTLRDDATLRSAVMVPISEVEMVLPVDIPEYTDFYSSRQHATNVGVMLRGPENALMPNWLHLPVAYHGRASTVVVSGTDIRRPCGQTKADDAPTPTFGPSRSLDFELEMGFFVGPGNGQGSPIAVGDAENHIFGLVLVNDWSARDIQKWEYQPLGPFLAKNFATSISPWIVPLEALEPFRCASPVQDPPVLPYLRGRPDATFDIHLEVHLQGERIAATNFKHLYWSMAQQLAHHTVNGCAMRTGDLLASGTISGPMPDSYGSLLELCWKGTKPLTLADGQKRTFLQDGDRLTLTGWCQGDGYRVGFGEVTGQILPARPI